MSSRFIGRWREAPEGLHGMLSSRFMGRWREAPKGLHGMLSSPFMGRWREAPKGLPSFPSPRRGVGQGESRSSPSPPRGEGWGEGLRLAMTRPRDQVMDKVFTSPFMGRWREAPEGLPKI